MADPQYLPLLSLDGQTTGENEGVTESDLLPDSTKLTMILEAAGDIKHAERTLREIDLLNQQGAGGSGSLESMSYGVLCSEGKVSEQAGLLPYKGELVKGLEETQARSKEMKESRKRVIDLLRRYNEFVSPPTSAG